MQTIGIIAHLCILVPAALSVPLNELFPFGNEAGDTELDGNDDGSSPEIILSTPFPYFNQRNPSLFVNTNGIISFQTAIDGYITTPFPIANGVGTIAPFWADVDTSNTGTIWYRESVNPTLLDSVSEEVRGYFSPFHRFRASWIFIVTWERVPFFGCNPSPCSKTNTFQSILISDGQNSFAIFNYEQIQWTTGADEDSGGNEMTGLGGIPAQVGFNSGDGEVYYMLNASRTNDIVNVDEMSNVGIPGKFMFRVDSSIITSGKCNTEGNLTVSPRYGPMLGGQYLVLSGTCVEDSANITATFEESRKYRCEKQSKFSMICITPIFNKTGDIVIRIEIENQGVTNLFRGLYTVVRTCDSLPVISGGVWNTSQTIQVEGSIAIFSCIPGYEPQGENYSTTCTNGSWSAFNHFSCHIVRRCDSLPVISGGVWNTSQTIQMEGSIAIFSCIPGYEPQGDNYSTTCRNGSWSAFSHFLCLRTCDSLPVISGGVWNTSQTIQVEGSIAIFSCIPGYEPQGDNYSTTCRNGSWSAFSHFLCLRTCDSLPVFDGGVWNTSQTIQMEGSIAIFSCIPGYEPQGDNYRTTCRNGSWSAFSHFSCLRRCDSLPVISGGVWNTSQTIQMEGSIAIFSCIPGYEPQGDNYSTTCRNGSWSAFSHFSCLRTCDSLPVISGGVWNTSQAIQVEGSIAIFSCIPGYEPRGDNYSTTCRNGSWSAFSHFSCLRACDSLPVFDGGVWNTSQTIQMEGSIAIFSCIPGYEPQGDNYRTTCRNGSWSAFSHFSCLRTCDSLPVIDGGVWNTSQTIQVEGSIAIFSCIPRYEPQGDNYSTTCRNGSWSAFSHFSCLRTCDSLPVISGGVWNTSQIIQMEGSIAIFSCIPGYEPQGDNYSTTCRNGSWSAFSHFSCLRRCDSLPVISGGVWNTSQTIQMEGSIAIFSCIPGYEPQGDNYSTTCRNGSWSAFSHFSCLRTCDSLPVISGGVWNTSQTIQVEGSIAIFSCIPGYEPQGDNYSTTCRNGSWSAFSNFSCLRTCDSLPVISGGVWNTSQTIQVEGSIAIFSCIPGCEPQGDNYSTTCRNGSWSAFSHFLCLRRCDSFPVISGGVWNTSQTIQVEGSIAIFSCIPGYEPQGDNYSTTCRNGSWSAFSHFSCLRTCDSLPVISGGVWNTSQTIQVEGSIAIFSCIPGYEPQGDNYSTTCRNGSWSAFGHFSCQRTCDSLPVISGGVWNTSQTIQVEGSIAIFSCIPGYEPQGDNYSTTCRNGSWSAFGHFLCLRTCESLPVIDGGVWNTSQTIQVEGSIATFSCIPGYEPKGDNYSTTCTNGSWSAFSHFSCHVPVPESTTTNSLIQQVDGFIMEYYKYFIIICVVIMVCSVSFGVLIYRKCVRSSKEKGKDEPEIQNAQRNDDFFAYKFPSRPTFRSLTGKITYFEGYSIYKYDSK